MSVKPDPAPVAAAESLKPQGAVAVALPPDSFSRPRASHFRWVILGLVFFAITINTIDRAVMSFIAPDLQAKFHIGEDAYGYIGTAFAVAYAFGQMVSGAWLDRIGTRLGYAIALTAWSLSSALHALARGALSFGFMRALLGISESPAFPAATKTLAEWFPKRERAFAMGFVNAGANVGAVLTPVIIPWVVLNYGLQSAFLVTGGIGLFWLVFWIPLYRRPHEHPWVSTTELALINSDPLEPTTKIRWVTLLGHRQTLAFALGKFLTDPIWMFNIAWGAKFLNKQFGLDLAHRGWPLFVVYAMADLGSIGGGWISSFLIAHRWSINMSRKSAMLLSALCVVPVMFATQVKNPWSAVALMGLGLAGHQGFSSNLYTLVSDMFPRRAVGSVAGLGGTFGYFGVALFSYFLGKYLKMTNQNYAVPFMIASMAYLSAFAVVHLLVPKLKPALVDSPESSAS